VIVIGLDPSPTGAAFAVLDIPGPFDRARYVAKGDVDANEAALVALVAQYGAELVAVEEPDGHIFHLARGKALMATKGVAARLAVWAERVVPVRTMACNAVRTALMGRRRSGGVHGDPAVTQWLRLFAVGWPAETPGGQSLSNNHTRDAAMVAIAGARKYLCDLRDARGRKAAAR